MLRALASGCCVVWGATRKPSPGISSRYQPMPRRCPTSVFETVFLYPWAIVFKKLGMFGLLEMAVFIGILLVGFAYVWGKGALEWD